MSTELTQLEAVLRRDRVVILAGVAVVALAAWAYVVYLAREMGTMADRAMPMAPNMVMPHMQSWGAVELLLLFVMWAVMMVAMMVPSAAPLVLMFARANRQKGGRRVAGVGGNPAPRLPARLERLQRGGDVGAVEASCRRRPVPDDGEYEFDPRRRPARSRRRLSIHPAEARLSGALSLTSVIS